jgi:hypothetical protein
MIYYKYISKNEENNVKSVRSKIIYNILIADSELKIKLFMLYLFVYFIESKTRKFKIKEIDPNTLNSIPHIGIDFEFKQRKIALMQINFETFSSKDFKTESYIWLLNPAFLNNFQNNILIKYLMINNDIHKILHGPDSQDIPYMYNEMFKKDKQTILKFTKKIIDTRFLCEYARLSIELDRKCSIYSALKYFGTISKQKYEALKDIEDSMGPKQDISWNINKMSSFHVKYAFYDVLFLKSYLMDIYKHINLKTPELLESYKYVNPIIRFVLLDRREIIKVVEKAKKDINPINNYMIKYDNQNFTLITIFNELINNFKVYTDDGKYLDFNFFLLIGFLKKSLLIMLKKIVYYVVRQNYTIFEKKNKRWKGEINLDESYNLMKKNRFFKIIKLFEIFKNEAFKRVILRFPKTIL